MHCTCPEVALIPNVGDSGLSCTLETCTVGKNTGVLHSQLPFFLHPHPAHTDSCHRIHPHHQTFVVPKTHVSCLRRDPPVYLARCACSQLHQEMSSKGLAPALLGEPSRWPGGFTLLEMEYLDPEDGWMQVRQYTRSRHHQMLGTCTGSYGWRHGRQMPNPRGGGLHDSFLCCNIVGACCLTCECLTVPQALCMELVPSQHATTPVCICIR
jgi:hypothetical protein